MRVVKIQAERVLPVHKFSVDGLSDVVVIAGPNGVGKSRLIDALLQKFQNPAGLPNIQMTLEATSADERSAWGKSHLDTIFG